MTVLGIDTSCDDTSIACIKDNKILSNVIFSQTFHSKYGGVLPELAARSHIKNIVPLAKKAIEPVGIHNLEGIGATYGPGLIGSLIVGLSFAKSMSYALGIPFYGVNHIEGHIFSLFVKNEIETPFIAFIISGGHTELILVKEKGSYELIGTTLDDAAGEAFDKVARMLDLPYPGGEAIEKLALAGNPQAIRFPRAQIPNYDFSFSGVKTSVLYYLKNQKSKIKNEGPDIAASFQEAVIDSLVYKAIKSSEELKIPRIGIAGGVARNKRLREKFREITNSVGAGFPAIAGSRRGGDKPAQNRTKIYFPEPEFCMDNGVMVALCTHYHLAKGESSALTIKATSQASL